MHQVVSPSVLPCLGTLADYLRRVAAQLLVDAGMTGEAQAFQPLKSAVDSQPLHLVLGSGCLNGYDVMHTPGTGHDALLQTFLTQSVGTSEFRNAQLPPLAAVVYLRLILLLLGVAAPPISFMFLLHSLLVLYRLL